jgi:AmmeMemoRadiSam system protein B/AmmeMemoRadiSam system protein A
MKRIKIFFLIILIVFSINCKEGAKMIREPVVAGSFYPGDQGNLRNKVRQYMENATVDIEGEVLGLISPHAGYDYSGMTAAFAYKALEGRDIDLVILLGPSHRAYINGFSVYDKGAWKTPLGEVLIDEEFANNLKKYSDLIDYFPEGHTGEHSLEVQLPFLQEALKNFKIVPITFNTDNLKICRILADALTNELKNRNKWIIIASTDLYHGYNYGKVKSVTDKVDDCIKNLDIGALLEFDRAKRDSGECAACGVSAATTMILTTLNLGANKAVLLHRTNSGDVTGMRSGYVVGYGAWVIIKGKNENKNKEEKEEEEVINSEENKGVKELSEQEKEELLTIARKTIDEYVRNGNIPNFEVKSNKLKKKSGAFVTIKKNGELKGCIGMIVAEEPLYLTVRDMAISAATRDPRFDPIKPSEIDDIKIEISVLTPFQKVLNPKEIKVGKDGLMIRKGFTSGLLLPQVPVEHGWDRETFLEHTCWKAGLPPNAWKDAELWKFQALVFSE